MSRRRARAGGGLRVFVALPVPEPMAGALEALAARLPLPRPVAGDALHVTLSFLGETPDNALEDAHHALAALSAPAVPLQAAGLGAFGTDPPRSLHMRLAPAPALMALQRKVDRALRAAALAPESRRFVPHVTLARWPRAQAEEIRLEAALAAAAGAMVPEATATAFALLASHRLPGGAEYETLALYPLGG
ncbi:MAG: RNA 2',3'-cyclic phosphodiesterase [Rhodobacteraceae bacterium]|nr:RNA 2',3'-cyclic phosphodiesterase [Paracoccaceae bacterium]